MVHRLFVVLEIFHLPQTFFRFGLGLVWSAQVFALLGKHFVAFFNFLDHGFLPLAIVKEAQLQSMHGPL
jgi:hypothetical protein